MMAWWVNYRAGILAVIGALVAAYILLQIGSPRWYTFLAACFIALVMWVAIEEGDYVADTEKWR